MKYYINILIIIVLSVGCDAVKEDVVEKFDCTEGEMKPAWYTMGKDEISPIINGLDSDFIILVDSNLKASNFISALEQYKRERLATLDTSEFNWVEGWKKMTTKQKLEKVEQEKLSLRIRADSSHILNNQGQQQVWIINNSEDTVTIQMQDWSFICILQAKTKGGKWYPVQYWRFSFCGNSYYLKHFPPKQANSFIVKRPNEGDFETKLRYKLLGTDKFHYSNEFTGKINYCEFVEDSTSFMQRKGKVRPNFKLDSLISLVWEY